MKKTMGNYIHDYLKGGNVKIYVASSYLTALDHPRAEEGFRRDMDAFGEVVVSCQHTEEPA